MKRETAQLPMGTTGIQARPPKVVLMIHCIVPEWVTHNSGPPAARAASSSHRRPARAARSAARSAPGTPSQLSRWNALQASG